MCVRAALSFGQFSKCLCEGPLLFSCCRLWMPFRRRILALGGCWILSGKAAERQVPRWRCVNEMQRSLIVACARPRRVPAEVLRIRMSNVKIKEEGGCMSHNAPASPPHISHRHVPVIPGVSGISPLVATETVTSAPCTWLQEAGLRGLQQQQLRPKERSISPSHW